MGPHAAQQKPKLWQLNYFTDKAELEAQGTPEARNRGGGSKKKRKETRNREGGHIRLREGVEKSMNHKRKD